jgi:hypothetical protein
VVAGSHGVADNVLVEVLSQFETQAALPIYKRGASCLTAGVLAIADACRKLTFDVPATI